MFSGGKPVSPIDHPKAGLRERKKAKTRATIQQHALRLFQEQGYQATTVEQIAEAAEISPSTFFRYFPTKEAVVLDDDYDPLLIEAFQAQPADLSPVQAMRRAIKTGLANIPDDERNAIWGRVELILAVPELRAAMLNQVTATMGMIAELIAERTGRDSDDPSVRTFAGAFIGAVISTVMHYGMNPDQDAVELLDQALAFLEAGMPL
jgi:AcrR family transcriptional regulator